MHTNEAIEGDKELLRARVIRRLRQVMNLGKRYDVKVLIGKCRPAYEKNNVLFDLPEYIALFDNFFRKQEHCLIQDMRMSTAGIFLR